MLRSVVLVAVLIAVTVALKTTTVQEQQQQQQCSVTTPSGQIIDISGIPTTSLLINQSYKGTLIPYTWSMNLCIAFTQPYACPATSGFISEYNQDGSCISTWTNRVGPIQFNASSGVVEMSFVNLNGYTAKVHVGCGSESGLHAIGDVDVDPRDYIYTFRLRSLEACPGGNPNPTLAPYSPPNPSGNINCEVTLSNGRLVDLGAFGVTTLSIDQVYRGYKTTYKWVFSLCTPVSQPPPSSLPCAGGPRYISQFHSAQQGSGSCETTWSSVVSPWALNATASGVTATFSNSQGWQAKVLLGCGPQASLAADSGVQVRKVPTTSGDFEFTFSLTSSVFC